MSPDASPLLTIVTVVRDDAPGLSLTQESLSAASSSLAPGDASKVEWVVVDGSSPPAPSPTPPGISTVCLSQPPQGIFEAMNAGLEAAQGRWIYFLNAGDTLANPHVLGRLLEVLGGIQGGWGFGGVRFRDPRGKVLREPRWDYAEHKGRLFAQGRFPPHQGTVVETALLRQVGGFDTRFRVASDYHTALRLSRLHDPVIWSWEIAEFHQGGTSSRRWAIAQREMRRARHEVFHPKGVARIREAWDSGRLRVTEFAARSAANMRG